MKWSEANTVGLMSPVTVKLKSLEKLSKELKLTFIESYKLIFISRIFSVPSIVTKTPM